MRKGKYRELTFKHGTVGRTNSSEWEREMLRSQVRAMWREGLTLREITAKTGYSERQILRIRLRYKLEPRREVLAPDRLDRAKKMIREGKPLTLAARSCHVYQGTLSAWAKKEHIQLRKPGERFARNQAVFNPWYRKDINHWLRMERKKGIEHPISEAHG